MIREVKLEDAEAIQSIYAPYCVESPITFEIQIPSVDEIKKRILENKKYGFFVKDVCGEVVSYAYASKHRERQAYQWCCETSIYTRADYFRKGFARELYEHLIRNLKLKNIYNAYAGITLPNAPSVKFHEALGFKLVGVYKNIGFKAGAWHDVGWWALDVREHEAHPSPPQL